MKLATSLLLAIALAAPAAAQNIEDRRVAGAVLLSAEEPPARIFADLPLPGPLSRGEVVIPYRTENLQMLPVFGTTALGISPRLGHIHVTLDDAPWVWVEANGAPVRLTGLPSGRHRVRLQLETPNHQQLAEDSVTFIVPASPAAPVAARASGRPQAKLVVDRPMAEPLARGVLFVDYRAEGVRLLPVFGQAALKVSPPLGHVHVTLDSGGWSWEAASGPIVINGLAPGRHQIQILLMDADHQPLDRGLVSFLVPAAAHH